MSGFIYLWFDRKHKRYYVGSHWGSEDDGYICSSTWMKNSYKRRPQDFTRRIINRINTSKSDLLKEEQRWLDMIKPEERKIRYYNINLKWKHWNQDPKIALSVAEKIRQSHLNDPNWASWSKGKKLSKEHKSKLSLAKLGKPSPRKGKKHSEESKKKMSISQKGNTYSLGRIMSEETKEKLRQYNLANPNKSWVGRKHSKETKEKMSKARLGKELWNKGCKFV